MVKGSIMTIYIRGNDNFNSDKVFEAGEVGSLAFLMHNSLSSNTAPGSTLAGSNLYPAAVSAYTSWGGTANGVNQEDASHTAGNYLSTSAMSGTWRCLGHSVAYASGVSYGYNMTVWVRTL